MQDWCVSGRRPGGKQSAYSGYFLDTQPRGSGEEQGHKGELPLSSGTPVTTDTDIDCSIDYYNGGPFHYVFFTNCNHHGRRMYVLTLRLYNIWEYDAMWVMRKHCFSCYSLLSGTDTSRIDCICYNLGDVVIRRCSGELLCDEAVNGVISIGGYLNHLHHIIHVDVCDANVRDIAAESPNGQRGDVQVTIAEGHQLLGLRGGGIDDGRGVLAWLYESDEETFDDDEVHDDWAREQQWMERHLVDETNDVDSPHATRLRPIVADAGTAESWTIFGNIHGTDTIVCVDCMMDIALGQNRLTKCECGFARCRNCAATPCSRCRQLPTMEISLAAALDEMRHDDTDNDHAELGQCQWFAPRLGTHTAAWTDDSLDAHDPRQTVMVMDAPAPSTATPALRCAECSVTSLDGDIAWRICRCRAVRCTRCASSPCRSCGQPPIASTPRGDDADGTDRRGVIGDEGPHDVHETTGAQEDEGDVNRALEGELTHHDARLSNGTIQLASEPARIFTPAEALERRDIMLAQARDSMNSKRSHSHEQRRLQMRQGRRPPRPRGRAQGIVLLQANVTTASSWEQEMAFGEAFQDVDFFAVQEHKLRGDFRELAKKRLSRNGWDAVVDEAYIKVSDPGGGTALAAAKWSGVRPIGCLSGESAAALGRLAGRASFGTIDVVGGTLLSSFYGLDGLGVAKQIPLWTDLAMVIRAIGLPFIILADWQVTPRMLQDSGWLRVLGGTVIAPETATNLITKRCIDYAVVSAELAPLVESVDVVYGARFSPHAPVRLSMKCPRALGKVTRLTSPKIYSAMRPPTSARQPVHIDWTRWLDEVANLTQHDGDNSDATDTMVRQWYASADLELAALFGFVDYPEEVSHAGLGVPPREVEGPATLRRRGAPDEAGLLGHRLAWAARTLHTALLWFDEVAAENDDTCNTVPALARPRGETFASTDMVRPFRCLVHRARAFRNEKWLRELLNKADGEDGDEAACLAEALEGLDMAVRGGGSIDEVIAGWANHGMGVDLRERLSTLEARVTQAISSISYRRRKGKLHALKAWAKSATLRQGHQVTRTPEANTAHSASASKSHCGERTEQLAADKGLLEWSAQWLASRADTGDKVAQLVSDVYRRGPSSWHTPADGIQTQIQLSAITGEKIDRCCKKFRGETGISLDHVRPRLVSWLSSGAKEGLAQLLNVIESSGRWPAMLRGTVAVALSKKGGGSRLIGIILAIYRIWSRVRYTDVQCELEARLARPFLSAAPGEGAARAAAVASLVSEGAHGRGESAATTMADIAKFYEQIGHDELSQGAAAFGLPQAITSLALHQYSGPRRLRVGKAHSHEVYPTRSLIPGCTWATILIRMLVIGPAEKFLDAMKARCSGFDIRFHLNIYVDDLALTTTGFYRELVLIHAWATRLLVQWITQRLRKRLAENKLICVASSTFVRGALAVALRGTGCNVTLEGDLLGSDYSAGGILRKRAGLRKRLDKNRRRYGRLRWWRRIGGDAKEVARGGTGPSIAFGATASGLPPKAAHLRRRLQGATTFVSASGSSLTTRLALGGRHFADCDPSVRDPNPPLGMLMALIWDRPQLRGDFIDAWYSTKEELAGLSVAKSWSCIRGIVSASWAHIRQHRAEWVAPFRVKLLQTDVDLICTPPKLVVQIMRAHARCFFFDTSLIERIASEHGAEEHIADILHQYRYGIDWDIVRSTLGDASALGSPLENRALHLLCTQALWPEDRRWKAGMIVDNNCTVCRHAAGTLSHRLDECPGVQSHMTWRVIEGGIAPRSRLFHDPGLLPLTLFGLPPRDRLWRPTVGRVQEGLLQGRRRGCFYGDGSGARQESMIHRRATWALYLHDGEVASSLSEIERQGGVEDCESYVRGRLNGWNPSVPRAEVRAVIAFLEKAAPGSVYHGDCRYAINVIMDGIPARFRSSWSGDADLWRIARRLLDEMVGKEGFHFVKVKAHRGRAAAECEGAEALRQWTGNARADVLARAIVRCESQREGGGSWDSPGAQHHGLCHHEIRKVLQWIAASAAWSLRHWPEVGARGRRKRRPRLAAHGSPEVGPHCMEPRPGGGLICSKCHLFSTTESSMRSLRNTPCCGTLTGACHVSHELRWSRGVLWCGKCGAFTIRRPRALKAACTNGPRSEAARNILRRLREGLLPTTACYLNDELKTSAIRDPRQRAVGGSSMQDAQPQEDVARSANLSPLNQPPSGGEPTAEGARYLRLDKRRAYERANRIHNLSSPSTSCPPRGGSLTGVGGRTFGPRILGQGGAEEERLLAHASVSDNKAAVEPSRQLPPATRSGYLENMASASVHELGVQVMDTTISQVDAEAAYSDRRRRIRGKQALPPSQRPPEPDIESQLRGTVWCKPSPTSSWTARIAISSTSAHLPCTCCGVKSRTSCRGCSRAVCVACARAKIHCSEFNCD